ncbi:hypothetical protein RRG08_061829 [Elysia crispata]|uniref:Uncharacterized protein n=1 Tax=Elysia crispata TaxID=231223 RepID=A0AAE1DRH6_9GAST|nr:hypothetical protein RRG08_061829 [Elysia crispata]
MRKFTWYRARAFNQRDKEDIATLIRESERKAGETRRNTQTNRTRTLFQILRTVLIGHFANMKTTVILFLAIFLIFAVSNIYAFNDCFSAFLGCWGELEHDKFHDPWCCEYGGHPTFTYIGDEVECLCA